MKPCENGILLNTVKVACCLLQRKNDNQLIAMAISNERHIKSYHICYYQDSALTGRMLGKISKNNLDYYINSSNNNMEIN